MEDLRYLDDEVLSLLELREDFLFHKLTKEQIKYYINESINLGQKTAQDFNNKDIEELLKNNGVSIIIEETNKSKKLDLRADIHFDDKIKEIKIYKKSLNQIYEVLKSFGLKVTEKQVYQIHLAHEFYHFIEFKDDKYTNDRLDKIVCFSLGPIKRKSTILKTREIAAHAFCKKLLNLKFHPKILDYIYLIENNEISNKELQKTVKELRKEYLN